MRRGKIGLEPNRRLEVLQRIAHTPGLPHEDEPEIIVRLGVVGLAAQRRLELGDGVGLSPREAREKHAETVVGIRITRL